MLTKPKPMMGLSSIAILLIPVTLAANLGYMAWKDRVRDEYQRKAAEASQKAQTEIETKHQMLAAHAAAASRLPSKLPKACGGEYAVLKTFEWSDVRMERPGTVLVNSYVACYPKPSFKAVAFTWTATAVKADAPGDWYVDDLTFAPAARLPEGTHTKLLREP
jgi:hypothetical protein